jgi:hypothetical protein
MTAAKRGRDSPAHIDNACYLQLHKECNDVIKKREERNGGCSFEAVLVSRRSVRVR